MATPLDQPDETGVTSNQRRSTLPGNETSSSPARCPACDQPMTIVSPEILAATVQPDGWEDPTVIAYTVQPCGHVVAWRRKR